MALFNGARTVGRLADARGQTAQAVKLAKEHRARDRARGLAVLIVAVALRLGTEPRQVQARAAALFHIVGVHVGAHHDKLGVGDGLDGVVGAVVIRRIEGDGVDHAGLLIVGEDDLALAAKQVEHALGRILLGLEDGAGLEEILERADLVMGAGEQLDDVYAVLIVADVAVVIIYVRHMCLSFLKMRPGPPYPPRQAAVVQVPAAAQPYRPAA